MAYLLGKRTRSRSIKHPLGQRKDIAVPDADKIRELKLRVASGDKQAVDELTKAHVRMAIHIAGQYAMGSPQHTDDLVSEAMLGIAMACDALTNGQQVADEQVSSFIAAKIHNLCSKFVRRQGDMRIPFTTAVRHKKKGKEITSLERHELQYSQPGTKAAKEKQWVFLHPRMCIGSDNDATDLQEVLDKAIKTSRQRKIMDLLIQSYDIREIAKELELTKSLVSLEIQTVRKEIQRLLSDGNANIPSKSKVR